MTRNRAALVAAVGVVVAGVFAGDARASLPPYTLVGSFALPAGAPGDFSPVPVDVLPDGRLIGVASDGRVLVQSSVNAGSYAQAGAVDVAIFNGAFGNFGASFVSVSPDGSRLAIGDNGAFNRVHFVEVGALAPAMTTPTVFAGAPNFDGAWGDGATLYVSGFGASAGLWRVDAAGLGATTIVENAVGGAGGVAIRAGSVFVGDGFNVSDGGGPTGNVRAFDLAALSAAGSAVGFETGVLVADALSASPLGFDALGNLLVGGGDFFAGSSDFGYAAVVDGDVIAAALLGGPVAPDTAELRLSPAGAFEYYGVKYNPVTEELLVMAGGVAYRYAVPAPGAVALLGLALVAARRRRARS